MDHNTIETNALIRQDLSDERPQASPLGNAVDQALEIPGNTSINLTLGGFASKTQNSSIAAGQNVLSGNTTNTTVNVIWPREHRGIGQAPDDIAQKLQKLRRCPNPSQKFTGRKDAIEKMRAYFFSDVDGRRVFVLHGLGGAGKTQIASKFIHDYCYRKPKEDDAQRIPIVFYVNATSVETLESSFSEAAVNTGIGQGKDDVLAWLSACNDDWLLFLDNADDPSLDLNRYFPSGPSGNILITTRNSHAPVQYTDGDLVSSFAVGSMSPDEAELLLGRLARSSGSSTEGIEVLAAELGYLALALAQAGSMICECRWSVVTYLELFRKRQSKVFQDDETRSQGVDGYGGTVYTTWLISYERLSPLARKIFQLCSHLHYDGIPEKMFQKAMEGLAGFDADDALPLTTGEKAALEELKELLGNFGGHSGGEWNQMKFGGVMRELMGYSLIEKQSESYRIHPLVHQWTQALALEIRGLHLLAMLFVASGAQRNADMLYAVSMVPHVNYLVKSMESTPAVVANIFGWSIYYQSGFNDAKAEPFLRHALQILQVANGGYDLQKCKIMCILGEVLRSIGQFEEAGQILGKALEKHKVVLGEDHPHTLTTMHNLASSLDNQGQFQEAERIYRHVLEKRKQLLREDHPDILKTMHNLAFALDKQGHFREAEKIYRHVLERKQSLHGEDHPSFLTSMHNLALNLENQGRFEEAETMYRHVVERREQLLGENHPDTVRTMHNLACTLHHARQPFAAIDLMKEVVEKRTTLFGKEHSNTLRSIRTLEEWRDIQASDQSPALPAVLDVEESGELINSEAKRKGKVGRFVSRVEKFIRL